MSKRCPDCGEVHPDADDVDEVVRMGLERFPSMSRLQLDFVGKTEEVFARSMGSFLIEQRESGGDELDMHKVEVMLGHLMCVVLSMRVRIAKLEARLLIGDVTKEKPKRPRKKNPYR